MDKKGIARKNADAVLDYVLEESCRSFPFQTEQNRARGQDQQWIL